MLQSEIKIGGTYRVAVSGRLAVVTVDRELPGRGTRRRYACTTHDTRRTVRATAARLRPMPGTAEAAAVNRRRAEAAAARAPRPFAGPVGVETVEAVPVPEMLTSVGHGPILRMSAANLDTIRRIVDGVHVAEGFGRVARVIRRRIGAQVIWRTIPRELRRGILFAAAERHAAGRRMYRVAMGHAPLPSPRMVAEAVGIAAGIGPMPR